MAATDAIIKLFKPGDEVICTNDLYGGTYRIFTKVYEKYGLKFHFTDLTDLETVGSLINENTRMIWIETPTNPMMQVIDIKAVAELGGGKYIKVVVDNTFATPFLQTPLDLGADLVVHSATKYLGGHSDAVLGAIATNDDELQEQLAFQQNTCGGVPGPQDCFLILRGIKTLHLRMERHASNGASIARYLRDHEKIDKVYWPGFEDHPNYDTAKSQIRHFGGMISFTLKEDSVERSFEVLEKFRVFSLAESLGGVESLAGHPASMTHASIPREERIKSGLKDSLIRLSVGVEDVDDLIGDLEQALA